MFKWSTLRAIGNSTAVKFSIVVPIIGYLVIFNEHVTEALRLSTEITGMSLEQPPSTKQILFPRLVLLYVGLSLVAAASVVYALACPDEVKRYGTSVEYIAGDGPHITEFAFELIERRLQDSEYESAYMRARNRWEPKASDVVTLTEKQWDDIKSKINKEILRLYYEYQDHSRQRVIMVGAALYVVGFGFIAVPSLEIFFRVARLVPAAIRYYIS